MVKSKKKIYYRYGFSDVVLEKDKHDDHSKFATVTLSNGTSFDVEMYLVECEDEDGNHCECEEEANEWFN